MYGYGMQGMFGGGMGGYMPQGYGQRGMSQGFGGGYGGGMPSGYGQRSMPWGMPQGFAQQGMFGQQQFQSQGFPTGGFSPAPQRQMPTYQPQRDPFATTGGGQPRPGALQDPSLAGTGGYSPPPMSKPYMQTGGMDPRPQGLTDPGAPQNSGLHAYQPQQPAAPQPFDPYKQFNIGRPGGDIPSFASGGMFGIQNPGPATGAPVAPQGGGGGMMPQATDLSAMGKAGAPQGAPSWTGTGDINGIGPSGAEEFIYNPAQYGKAVNGSMRFSSGMTNPSQGLGGNMWLTDASGRVVAGDPNKAAGYAHGLGGLQASGLQQGQRYKLNYAGMPGSSRLSGNY